MRPWLMGVVLVLAACDEGPKTQAWPLAEGEVAWAGPNLDTEVLPPPGQALNMSCEALVAGQPVALTAADADPGETIFFGRSLGKVGQGPCPASMGGVCLDITKPALAGSTQANAQGVAVFHMAVPASATPGTDVHFQAVAIRGQGGVDTVKSQAVTCAVGGAWSNPNLVVDGQLTDFVAGEDFATTSGGATRTYISWTPTDLYVASHNSDVGASPEHWLMVYIGTASGVGTTVGVQHNTQQPDLGFEADYLIRWKADGSWNSLESFDGQAWVSDANWLGRQGTGSEVAASNVDGNVELRIPRSLLSASNLQLQVAWVYEGQGYESTYAGSPDQSFVDGYDPDFSGPLALDLTSATAPNMQ